MRIDKTLNIVIPVYDDADNDDNDDDDSKAAKPRCYVHSAPVSTAVWDTYWKPISLAYTQMMAGGHTILGGPRVAHKILQEVAEELGMWDTRGAPHSVKKGMIAEIHRNTNVLAPGENGWETIPYTDAIKIGTITPDDANDIEGGLVFFTLASLMNRRKVRQTTVGGGMAMWGARTTSLNSTEYLNFLSTLTEAENSGENKAESLATS